MTEMRHKLNQALTLHQANRLPEAERLYREVLSREPLNAAALHHLGLILCGAGQVRDGLRLLSQSIQLDSGNTRYRMNQIGAMNAAGFKDPAQVAAAQLVAERPNDVNLRIEYAHLLARNERFHLAAAEMEIVVSHRPDDAAIRYAWAYALQRTGNLSDAEREYRKALELRPNYVEALTDLGMLVSKAKRYADAQPLLEKAIGLSPDNSDLLVVLGSTLLELEKPGEAISVIKRALSLKPDNVAALRSLGRALVLLGDHHEAFTYYDRARAFQPRDLGLHSETLMSRLFADATPQEEFEHFRQFQNTASTINANPPPARELAPGERLRIGYVSGDFNQHAAAHFITPLLEHHDRTAFEVHCFSVSATDDMVTQRIIDSVDTFHRVPGLNAADLDLYIRAQPIDILIDLSGHSGGHRMELFARKPAPVQITYLGYPGTTGLAAIDFRITDAIADPPGFSDTIHSEKLLRLPTSFGLFSPFDGMPEVAPSPINQNGHVTFGIVSRMEKWNEPTLRRWATVVNRVPGSRLKLIGRGYDEPEFRARTIERLQSVGVNADRVELVGRRPLDEFMAEISKFDLILDTFPFNGHTTTLQAIYMGVPTVTLAGKAHRSRMGASVMHALGLNELVAESADAFVQIATALATDASRLLDLRTSLRQRLEASSLMNGPEFMRGYAACLQEAWRIKVSSQKRAE